MYCCDSFIHNEKYVRTLEMLYANTDHVRVLSAKYFLFLNVACHASRIKFCDL